MRLDTSAARPLYLQLRDTLLRRIQAGEFCAHQRLPSERQLSRQYTVSRITVRQALTELTQGGHVYTRVGKGTYVSDPSMHRPLSSLFGFSESVLQHGRTPTSRILEARVMPSPADVAERLHVAPDEPLVYLHRLRLVDDVPIALEMTYLLHAACPGLIEHMAHNTSLYSVLERTYGLAMAYAEITLGAALADEEEARLLKLSTSSAVLHSEQTSFVQDGRPMELNRATYRGDGYHFNATLYRSRSPQQDSEPHGPQPAEGIAVHNPVRLHP